MGRICHEKEEMFSWNILGSEDAERERERQRYSLMGNKNLNQNLIGLCGSLRFGGEGRGRTK